MRRFNLSAWAVAHPALILFLIVMFGVAGLLSYRSLGRAEDPSFTIKVAVVTAMWPGATAADMQAQVADPIEKKLQELALFRQGHDLHQAGLHSDAGRLQGQHAGAPRAGAVLPAAQENQRHQGRPAVGPDRPVGQRRIWRRRFDPLHADGQRRRLCPDEKGRRSSPPAAAEGQERHQGQSLRHAGRKDLRRVFQCQAGDARHHHRPDLPVARQAECRRAGRHCGVLGAACSLARDRRA